MRHRKDEALFNAIGHMTLILDSEHNIISANRAAAKLTGLSQDELAGRKCYELFHGASEPPAGCPLVKMKISKQLETSEMFVKTLGVTALVSCTPVLDDAGRLEEVIHIAMDITGRKLADEKIQNLLAEKELILREVHHRIKNNMNTIAGLLYLQSEAMKAPEAAAALKDARSRVVSAMILYDKLYRSDNFQKISIKDYLTPLVNEIFESYPNKSVVKLETHIDNFTLDAKKLFPLGIILNELLTNAMKYAFIGLEEGLIRISAGSSNDLASITIENNGNEIEESVDFTTSKGFGLQLVSGLARQIGGSIRIERNNGTKFILEFET